jgi:hypothetical protein
MKNYQKLLTAVSISLCTALPVQALDVPTPFAAGDPLTATRMEEVRDAINDNDSRVTTNTGDIATNLGDVADLQSAMIDLFCDTSVGVYSGNQCFYLDGSGGVCESDYVLAPQSILTTIAGDFVGKTYRTNPSGGCCIVHADQTAEGQDWGMGGGDCNAAGPFVFGPELGAVGCTDANVNVATSLTLCVSKRSFQLP